ARPTPSRSPSSSSTCASRTSRSRRRSATAPERPDSRCQRSAFPGIVTSRSSPRALGGAVMRVGIGHDTHRLAEGRPLLLGGFRVEHTRGLVGHSDADVVLHAVTDALLGAAGLGDIGDAYPDTDPAWRDADSRHFLDETLARLNRAGWRVVNVDVIVFAQEPKLGPVKAAIRRPLAALLRLGGRAG